jgi:hypothetical protein
LGLYLVLAKLLFLLPFKDLGSVTTEGNDQISGLSGPMGALEGASLTGDI